MTFTVDFRNFLVAQAPFKALISTGKVASDSEMPEGYVFEGKPLKKVERLNKKALLVISSYDNWSSPNAGAGWDFPKLIIDIWASPSRDAAGNVEVPDADDLIREIYKVIRPYIHVTNRSDSNGGHFVWGRTVIATSEIIDGPTFFDVANGNGARMARIEVGVTL